MTSTPDQLSSSDAQSSHQPTPQSHNLQLQLLPPPRPHSPIRVQNDLHPPIAARVPLFLTPAKLRRSSSETFLLRSTHELAPLPTHGTRPLLPLPHRSLVEHHYDHTAALSFAQDTVSAVNDAATCILISIGHQLGLFTVLSRISAQSQPAHTIASMAYLNPRLVSEWLSAMTCAAIVESTQTSAGLLFRLPPEHSPWLTYASSTNFALLCQTIPCLARLESDLTVCYRRGVGLDRSTFVPYERLLTYDVMQTIGSRIVPVLRLVEPLLSELASGICVLCVGSTADAVYVRLARLFPRSWFTCYGTSERHAASARRTVEESGVTNVHFKTISSMDNLRERGSFDVALVLDGAAVRLCARPVHALSLLRMALRPGRPLLYVELRAQGEIMADRAHRAGTFLYAVSALHAVPKAMVDGDIGEAVGGIWGHVRLRNALYDADFATVDVHALEDDSLNCVLVAMSGEVSSET